MNFIIFCMSHLFFRDCFSAMKIFKSLWIYKIRIRISFHLFQHHIPYKEGQNETFFHTVGKIVKRLQMKWLWKTEETYTRPVPNRSKGKYRSWIKHLIEECVICDSFWELKEELLRWWDSASYKEVTNRGRISLYISAGMWIYYVGTVWRSLKGWQG